MLSLMIRLLQPVRLAPTGITSRHPAVSPAVTPEKNRAPDRLEPAERSHHQPDGGIRYGNCSEVYSRPRPH